MSRISSATAVCVMSPPRQPTSKARPLIVSDKEQFNYVFPSVLFKSTLWPTEPREIKWVKLKNASEVNLNDINSRPAKLGNSEEMGWKEELLKLCKNIEAGNE